VTSWKVDAVEPRSPLRANELPRVSAVEGTTVENIISVKNAGTNKVRRGVVDSLISVA
jgi:hypothetical protein